MLSYNSHHIEELSGSSFAEEQLIEGNSEPDEAGYFENIEAGSSGPEDHTG